MIGAANLGPQDQAAVLRWVRDNIASFGGDAHSVTVGGQSAGAPLPLMLALDPATNPSITRVLLHSGPSSLDPQNPHQAADNTDTYLRPLDIPAGTDTAKTLRALLAEQLLDAYGRLSAQLTTRATRPRRSTRPSPPLCFPWSCNGAAGLRARYDCGPLSIG
ncbi:carboxylesterase family protein [Streptomyces collinus]|uniref:carboxylesterase family protein n=1 Tax=Streptomyces collinus TaxID=42684 RepID=UPI0037A8E605